MKTILARLMFLALALASLPTPTSAATATAAWTWPTTRTDGTALSLSSIGALTLYDTSVPVAGAPGTVVSCPVTIPPTTATGTCTATGVTQGHSFVLTVSDNASPPDVSAVSNSVTLPVTIAPPSAITNFTFH